MVIQLMLFRPALDHILTAAGLLLLSHIRKEVTLEQSHSDCSDPPSSASSARTEVLWIVIGAPALESLPDFKALGANQLH